MEDNYGGEALNGAFPESLRHSSAIRQARNAVKRFTNAYILVYIREPRLVHLRRNVSNQVKPTPRLLPLCLRHL